MKRLAVRERNSLDPLRHNYLPALLVLGDSVAIALGFSTAFLLRFHTDLQYLLPLVAMEKVSFSHYVPLIVIGTIVLILTFVEMNLYDVRFLLRRLHNAAIIFRGSLFWLFGFFCVSFSLNFEPPLSRAFIALAYTISLASIISWRALVHFFLGRHDLRARLAMRTAIIGWNRDAERLYEAIIRSKEHPYSIIGVVQCDGVEPLPPPGIAHRLGALADLQAIIQDRRLDAVILADLHLSREQLGFITSTCDLLCIDLKVVPTMYQVFLSGLTLQTVGAVPILSVEDLPLQRLGSRVLKRSLDIVGAIGGLTISAPIIGILAVLIRRESPGPAIFMQERIGERSVPFKMYKLRSMRMGADQVDDQHPHTRHNDERLLKIGRFVRHWNLDELPQFWNVLCGQMSLVGPRPERPSHAERFARTIPNYLRRHIVKPGMSGWAQVNGFRGESSLEMRIQYDIHYIEKWTIWFDLWIVVLTFVRWTHPKAPEINVEMGCKELPENITCSQATSQGREVASPSSGSAPPNIDAHS